MARPVRGSSPDGIDWGTYELFRARCLSRLLAIDDPSAPKMYVADLPPDAQERFIRSSLEFRARWFGADDFSHGVIAALKDGDLP